MYDDLVLRDDDKLDRLYYEMLPNEVRNLPRLGNPRRRQPPPLMTPAMWAAWGINWFTTVDR